MRPIGSDDNNGVGRFGSKAASEAYSSSILASGCFRGYTSHSPLNARGWFRPEAAVQTITTWNFIHVRRLLLSAGRKPFEIRQKPQLRTELEEAQNAKFAR